MMVNFFIVYFMGWFSLATIVNAWFRRPTGVLIGIFIVAALGCWLLGRTS